MQPALTSPGNVIHVAAGLLAPHPPSATILTWWPTCRDTAELIAFQEGRYESFEYGRYGNPTTHVCEEKLAELEGAETALLSTSGMNSATTMLLALVPAGEASHPICHAAPACACVTGDPVT